MSVLEVLAVVEAVQKAMQVWRYEMVGDDKTCPRCNRYAGSRMTRREVVATFPFLERHSELIWYPHVHPHCRCELWLEEEGELAYPFKPIPADDYK